MILTIAAREIRSGLVTPLLWVLLGASQVVLGWVLLQAIESFTGLKADERVASLSMELSLNLFGVASAVALLAAPLIAMRMLSGELRDGIYDLIGSSPVRIYQIVGGKYLALVVLLTPLCLLPALNLALLAGGARLDPGMFAAATLGLWLAGLMFAAVGLYASSLSAQPGAAVLAGFGILLLFSVIGRAEGLAAGSLSLFGWLAWNEHLLWFLLGAVRMGDLAYFLIFAGLFLALTHRRLANRHLQ
jgi:ABC-2 type transport system permease protein